MTVVAHTYDDGQLVFGDNLEWLSQQEDHSVDLILGSPPYEDVRSYGIDFNLRGQAWVDWMLLHWAQMNRVSRGLVAMVVEGKTEDHQWSATPALLMADLHRAGIKLRKPPLYVRWGLPGSGGGDWLRNRYEFIICSSVGKLPWSDPTAMGKPPVYKPGGNLTNRNKEGQRSDAVYKPPKKANPGNLVICGSGGNQIGSDKGHANEAPFPERLAEYFIRSFCPKGGLVVDPFSGGGTTVSVARQHRRRFVGIDVRQSQIDLAHTRLEEARLRRGFDLD